MRFEERFEVPTDPQRTFDYLADVTNEAKWNPWAIEVRGLDDGPIGEGSRFSGRYKRIGVAEQWLGEFDPPKRVVYRSKTMDGRMTFDLEPAATGTRVTLVAEATPKGVQTLMTPLMRPMMGRHIRDVAHGIRRELET